MDDDAKPTKEQLENAIKHYGGKKVPTNLPGLFPGSADAEVGKDHRTLRTIRDKKGRVLSTKTLGSLVVEPAKVPKLKTDDANSTAAGTAERPSSARSGATQKTYNMTQYTGGQTQQTADLSKQQQKNFDSTKMFD